MSETGHESDVTKEGLASTRPGREAAVDDSQRRQGQPARKGGKGGGRGGPGGGQPVSDADFRSYYGMPVINKPVWEPLDIAGYLFLGGLAGAGSALGAAADVRGDRQLAAVSKTGSAVAITLSLVALVHDLGKPSRFPNMLRVFKITSPMSVGSWLLAAYSPMALVAAASEVTGRVRPLGVLGTTGAAALGPAVASYTAVLISDTAVPAWHDGHREMPYVFVGSGAMAAGGLGLIGASVGEQRLPRRVALVGAAVETVTFERLKKSVGIAGTAYDNGTGGRLVKLGEVLAASGCGLAVLGRGRRRTSALAGGLLLAASAVTRFGIFHAGVESAQNPEHTIKPQRERLDARGGVPTRP
jgi:hypothetical protein